MQKYFNFLLRLGTLPVFTLVLCFQSVQSQSCQTEIEGTGSDVSLFQKHLEKLPCDSIRLNSALNYTIYDLYNEGYLLANYVMESDKDNNFKVEVFAGPKYKWASLSSGNVPEVVLSKIGFREKFFLNKKFDLNELDRILRNTVRYSEEQGYPFASVKLDSIIIEEESINAVLKFDPGIKITYDSLKVNTDFKIKPSWLAAYLNLKQGDEFNQKSVNNIPDKLNQLKFIELSENPTITFQNEEAIVGLSLKRTPNNRVDGIIGFLPNEEQQGSLLVTGQFDLSLSNLFNSGKVLNIKWQSLKARSQFLDFNYYHRNLFHSALHLSSSFQILKEDTLFINREGQIAFNYNPNKHGVELFTRFRSSRLLSTEQFREITRLPETVDFNLDYYGVKYYYNEDIISNWRKNFFSTNIEVAVGSKRIRRNNGIAEELYEGLDFRSVQYNLNGTAQFYTPLNKSIGIYWQVGGGKVLNETLFLNDLYRIGGLKSLRGFNENFFFASDYLLSNIELRLYFQRDSYLFTFYDQSYLYYNIETADFEDYPLGVGVGFNYATKSGIISLAYGVGRSQEQPLSLSLSKFHFGYITKF